jgi:hypothetical protein
VILEVRITWSAPDLLAAALATYWARRYLNARNHGEDPAGAVQRMLPAVLQDLIGQTKSGSNLTLDGHGLRRVATSVAARQFLRAAAGALIDDEGAWQVISAAAGL